MNTERGSDRRFVKTAPSAGLCAPEHRSSTVRKTSVIRGGMRSVPPTLAKDRRSAIRPTVDRCLHVYLGGHPRVSSRPAVRLRRVRDFEHNRPVAPVRANDRRDLVRWVACRRRVPGGSRGSRRAVDGGIESEDAIMESAGSN